MPFSSFWFVMKGRRVCIESQGCVWGCDGGGNVCSALMVRVLRV